MTVESEFGMLKLNLFGVHTRPYGHGGISHKSPGESGLSDCQFQDPLGLKVDNTADAGNDRGAPATVQITSLTLASALSMFTLSTLKSHLLLLYHSSIDSQCIAISSFSDDVHDVQIISSSVVIDGHHLQYPRNYDNDQPSNTNPQCQ